MPDDTNKVRNGWAEFASWHGDPTLYREIYTRAIGALIAALVIYLVAALFGVVSAAPGIWIGAIGSLTGGLVAGWIAARRSRKAEERERRGDYDAPWGIAYAGAGLAALTAVVSLVAQFINR